MHIGHDNMRGNYNISNQQLPTADLKRDLGINTKDRKWQKQTQKSCKTKSSLSQKSNKDDSSNQKPQLPPANPGP